MRGGETIYNTPVIAPKMINATTFDCVLIAVYAFEAIRDIYERLLQMAISADKIKILVFEKEYLDTCMDQRMYWIQDFAKTVYENKLNGCVAEGGVFRGDSAKYINKFFPDKKLYLFDTFEGFNKKDVEYEMGLNNKSYNESRFTNAKLFADTTTDLLLRKMLYPDVIEIRKGYFPETTRGIDCSFVFVNLDMDLYLPMLAGLEFFWDRLVKGGCILLHDYYHPSLPGVKKAVEDFEAKKNICIMKAPIGDGCSIALLK